LLLPEEGSSTLPQAIHTQLSLHIINQKAAICKLVTYQHAAANCGVKKKNSDINKVRPRKDHEGPDGVAV
jgi:hypothetical protein